MSWSSWGAKLNVQSIVSQGLEQVSKLKEDVEKQFDQVVTASSIAQPPGSSSRASAAATAAAQDHHAAVEPPSPAVSVALFGDANGHASVAPPPPPRSLDSTSSAALLASLGLTKASAVSAGSGGGADAPSSAPTSRTSKNKSTTAAVDFFGSYLPPAATGQNRKENGSRVERETPAVSTNESEEPVEASKPVADAGETDPSAASQAGESDEDKRDKDVGDCENKAHALVTNDGGVPGGVLIVSGSEELGGVADEGPTQDTDGCGNGEAEGLIEKQPDNVARENGPSNTLPLVEREEEDASEKALEGQLAVAENGVEHRINEPDMAAREHNHIAKRSVDETPVVANHEVESLKQQLAQRETQLLSTSAVIQELHDELDKTCQREVAAVEKNRFLNEQLELLRHEVLRLNRVVGQQQQQASRDHELAALQQAVAEKDDKLQALLDEGQALSVKQSQLEQRLRQLRREKNEEEEQKLVLQAHSDTLAIKLQELTSQQKNGDEEKKTLQCELKAAQQVAEKANKDLADSQDELARQKDRVAQLEADVGSLKEDNESMRAELERLQHTSDSHATLSVEKSEMEATIQYLQQTVRGLESENARREEIARIEIADLKRKWKDALHRVEALGQSVSEATQPLLRQIYALQEDQRARQDTWKATEQTLLQRIADANTQRKEFETDKLTQEQQLHDLQTTIDDLHQSVRRKEAEALRDKERVDAMLLKEREARGKCDVLQIELDELKHKFREEQHAKEALLARVAMATAADSNTKRDNEALVLAETTTLVAEMQQLKQREEKLRHDLEWHQKELQRVKAATLSPRLAMLQQRRSFDEDWSVNSTGSPRVASQDGSTSQASILQRTLESSVDDSRLSSTSVLGLSQLQQRLRLREGENRLLRQQLQAVEEKQKQTTDEIVRLSTRNALLESSATQFEATQQQLEQLKQKQHVLLELFGEKEEQVEELQAEVKELKAFYRKQLDTLAGQQK